LINKYSLWVAAAVNMGILNLANLTSLSHTSITSAYSVSFDDDDGGDDDDDGFYFGYYYYGDDGGTGPAADCTVPRYYGDGYCDSVNNVADCDYDGGDCCESTCEDGSYFYCGIIGYDCQNPDAPDNGHKTTTDDDGNYYYDDFYYDNGDDDSCSWFEILLLDSECDGWEGNYLNINGEKV
jgi:hypothetical protein